MAPSVSSINTNSHQARGAMAMSQSGGGRPSSPYEYVCLFNPCTRDSCVIHGRPSPAELSARIPHATGGYYPENPQKLCELDDCGLHVPPIKVFSVHPAAINREEPFSNLPIGDKLGMKKALVEKDNLIDLSTSPVSMPSMQSTSHFEDLRELMRGVIGSGKFIKPSKWYVMSLIERGDYLDIPRNLDFISKIFANEDERYEAFEAYYRDTILRHDETPPSMLTYGIQYAPEPGKYSSATSRKVFITGLDPSMPLYDTMARVGGGKILGVITAISPRPIGYTVIVEFVDPQHAKAYVDYVADKTVDVFYNGVEVTLLRSHSYPISMEIQNDLRHEFTRLVVYLDFSGYSPEEFLDDFEARFKKPEDVLEDLWLDDNETLYILFKTVEQAGRFYKQTTRDIERESPGAFKDDLYRFAPDPCDKPLDDMQEPDQLARGTHQSLLEVWIEGKKYEEAMKAVKEAEEAEEAEGAEGTGEIETGQAALVVENALAAPAAPAAPSPPKSGTSSSHPNTPSLPEPPREIPGLGSGMWMRDFFIEALRRLDEPDYDTFPQPRDFRRHRGQSRFMLRRQHRDASLSRSWYPHVPLDMSGNGQGISLEEFAREQAQGSNGQGGYSVTPMSLPSIGVDSEVQRSSVTTEKTENEYKDKDKEEPAETAPKKPDATSTQSPRAIPGPEVSEPSSQAIPTPTKSSLVNPYGDLPREVEDDSMVAKYMLPQNDPAFTELLNRDRSDLVSKAEAKAILQKQEFRSYSKEEMRARYSALFPTNEALKAWDRGDEYDLVAALEAVRKEGEKEVEEEREKKEREEREQKEREKDDKQ
ncbi:hypothetical protein F4781DRAFT_445355 [Annulohypoxylon bovei var. microspora]|nr:hypothetical protein F4781DRAFT_445355 [Annulohypoxylon bovei var. microspora]